jgi:nitrogen regulatory protein PII
MPEMIEIRRVTVMAETALEHTLLDAFTKMGVKGYTCVYCFGKGRHEVIEDPYTGRSLVRIEMLARSEVAEAILAYVHKTEFSNYPVIGFMDKVQVYASDRIY